MWNNLLNKNGEQKRCVVGKRMLHFCFFSLAVLSWSNHCINGWNFRYSVITIIGAALVWGSSLLLLPYSNQKCWISLKQMVIPLIMLSVMTVSAIINRIDNLLFPFITLVVFPICWSIHIKIKNREIVYLSLSKGILGSFLIFFILSMVFSPITMYQYTGIFNNCNGTAQYLTAVLPCILYLESKQNKRIYLLCAACCCVVMVLTKSRTGLLAMVIIILTWAFFELRNEMLNRLIHTVVKRMMLLLLIFLIVFPVFWGINRFFMYTIQDKYCLNAYEEVMKERGQTIYDMNFEWLVEDIDERVVVGEQDANEYSSGRIGIWSDYLKEMNLWGHSIRDDDFARNHSTAHNAFIQIAYDYGLVSGIMYIVIIAYVSWKTVRSIWLSFSKEKLYFMTILLGYGVTSMLASSVFPFTYLITCLFYFVLSEIIVVQMEDNK